MRSLSRFSIIIIVFLLLFAIFVARVSKIITVKVHDDSSHIGTRILQSTIYTNSTRNLPSTSSVSDIVLDDKSDHLMWFIQISDLHISVFHDSSRLSEFRIFCEKTVPAVKPDLVLATGDLTDAKEEDQMGSRQYLQEWKYYKNALVETGVLQKTTWLDIRGNHDNFNVIDIESDENYYRKFSVQGRNHPRSYKYNYRKNHDVYSFVAMDASLQPGPRRPFNFVGMLTTQEYATLEKFAKESFVEANVTLWFGHYPTSSIVSPHPGVRDLMRQSLVYLCGHFHTLIGLLPHMYTLQHQGYLELELADWKDSRRYRIAAVDHGVFSFTDIDHGRWPVVLVTNPKHALFHMPSQEPLALLQHSTHIRLLVFSDTSIKSVKVSIDDSGEWVECHSSGGPLYTLHWKPHLFKTGIHMIKVYAKDNKGRVANLSQPFSLDGSRLEFDFFPRLALMANLSLMFQLFYGIMTCVCIIPLCVFRILHRQVLVGKIHRPRSFSWVRKMWVLSSVDRLFFPLVAYTLYLTFGPWFVGELLDGYFGVTFAWGTIVNWTFLPGSLTYIYGFAQLFLFNFPLTLCLAHSVDVRLSAIQSPNNKCKVNRFLCHGPFFAIVILQAVFAYFFCIAYGVLALLLGPFRTWSVILGLVLWYQARNLSEEHLRSAAVVWCNRKSRYSYKDSKGKCPSVELLPAN